MNELRRSFQTPSNSASNLKLISLVLSGKIVDFSRIISLIDETVTLLEAEQGEDDSKEAYCIKNIGQTEDEDNVSAHHISGHRDAVADFKDQLSNTDARIERIVEETIDVHVPRVMGETVEAVKLIPQDKVQNCTLEQIVAVAAGEMIQLLLHGRISERIIEQTVEAPVPQIRVHCVEAMKVILQERLATAHREAESGKLSRF